MSAKIWRHVGDTSATCGAKEKNEAPYDDAASDFECGRSRSITKGFLPTIKLVNLSTRGHAEFALKLRIAY